MNKRAFFLVFSVAFIFASCKKEVFSLSEEVSIGFNTTILVDTADGEQMEIKYMELVEESRCPPGANCFSIGNVKVKLKLDDKQYIELGWSDTTFSSVTYNNRVITLVSVDYDSDNDFGKEKKSSVVIRVD